MRDTKIFPVVPIGGAIVRPRLWSLQPVGVLGTGVPRPACLRPRTWPTSRAKISGKARPSRGPELAREVAPRPARSGPPRAPPEGWRSLCRTRLQESRMTQGRTDGRQRARRCSYPFGAKGARTYAGFQIAPKGFHSGATRPWQRAQ